MTKAKDVKKELRKYADKNKAKLLARYFKTGPGEYAQGDIFIGVMVPYTRKVVKKFEDLPLAETLKLLRSKIHEERLTALLILVRQFEKADERLKEKIYNLYLANTRYINNWDLVDLSAPKIAGKFLIGKDRKLLYKLAKSPLLWERRIAILSTFAFIRQHQFDDAFRIAGSLLSDNEDLIHKACGWMLREVGKRNSAIAGSFLDKYCRSMPRVMLRYAIERLPETKRKKYLSA